LNSSFIFYFNAFFIFAEIIKALSDSNILTSNTNPMKKLLLLIIVSLHFTISYAQLPDLNGYWGGTYYPNSGSSGDFNCAFYQDGNSVYGISVDTDDDFLFEGTIYQDTCTGNVTEDGSVVCSLSFYESGDSVLFNYEAADMSFFGNGFIEKISDCATLIVDYTYNGSLVNVSEEYPIDISVYDTDDIMSAHPILTARYPNGDGIVYIPGILTDSVYCVISTGFNERQLTFYDADMPYSVYGPDPGTFELTPIIIASGGSETIDITFDDTYLYHMEAYYPGGKMDYVVSYDLPYSPKYIAYYNEQFYIVNNSNQVLIYSKSFVLLDTLKDNYSSPIFAHAIQFHSSGEFYTCDNTTINRFSANHELLNDYPISSTEDSDFEILSDQIFYSNRNQIIKFDNTLSTVLATLTKTDIQTDYPPFASQDFWIRDIAFDNDSRLAIAIDANPDQDGKDMVIFYNSTLDNVVDTIVGYWIMNNPKCVDFDDSNYCYVANYWHDALSVHDPNKALYSASYWLDEPGTTNGAMHGPVDHIIVDRIAYVIENVNNRVSIFKLNSVASVDNLKFSHKQTSIVYPVPFSDKTNIAFELNGNENVSINVYDLNGRLVEKVLSNTSLQKGKHNISWGNNSLKGMYCIVINIGIKTETHRIIKL